MQTTQSAYEGVEYVALDLSQIHISLGSVLPWLDVPLAKITAWEIATESLKFRIILANCGTFVGWI